MKKAGQKSRLSLHLVRWNGKKKEKSVEKPSENTSPIREYIKTALSRGMSKEKIQSNLIAKGWKEEDVKKELEKK